jgi:hypothetical protein
MSVSTSATAATASGAAAGSEFLRKDLLRINAEFDSGKLRAFGDAQDDVLKQFQRVRQLQVALSLKQVAMLGDDKEHSERDIDELTRRLTEIAAEMQSVMGGASGNGGAAAGGASRLGSKKGARRKSEKKSSATPTVAVDHDDDDDDDDDDVDDVDDDDDDDDE